MTHKSGVFGSASTETRLSFKVNETMFPPFAFAIYAMKERELGMTGTMTSAAQPPVTNPFFEPWTTPFGVPPFPRMKPEHFVPAFERAFAEHGAEIAAISGQGDPPTFSNTIEAYERSGRALQRVD